MPNHKRALQNPNRKNYNPVAKPEPSDELWDEIIRIRAENPRLSNSDPGITIKEYAEKFGMKRSTANNELLDLVEQGKLKGGWRLMDGRKYRVFRSVSSV